MDGFVVPEGEGSDDEDGGEGKEERQMKKRSYQRLKRGGVQLLDQEDLELIAENTRLRQEAAGIAPEVSRNLFA